MRIVIAESEPGLGYDTWFRSEIEAALQEARSGDDQVSHEEVKANRVRRSLG